MPSSPSVMPLTAALVMILIPRLLRTVFSLLATSLSNGGRISLQYSMTVTSTPNVLNTAANSIPMTPPPTMHRLLGSVSIARISSLVMARSAPSMGRPRGAEPVAMMMFLALYSSPLTTTVLASFRQASPLIAVMPGAPMSISTPSRNCLTTASLRSNTGA